MYNFIADVYLAGTVMLIFAMGLYGLFVSNAPNNVSPVDDRALKGSTLFGMFAMRVRHSFSCNEVRIQTISYYCSPVNCIKQSEFVGMGSRRIG